MLLALTFAALSPPAAASSPLEGEWSTGCAPIGQNGRHGFITRITATGDALTAVAQVYAHNNCDTPTMRTTYRATIIAATKHEGSIELDHVVESITMTLDAADIVAVYNRPGSGCGFGSGWQLGAARDVAGRRCAPFSFPLANTRLYERLWLAGDTLQLGSFPIVWTNTSPELRPTKPGRLRFQRVGQ